MMPNEMPSLLIPASPIAFVKGRFVTDINGQIARLARWVRLFPREICLLPSDSEKAGNTRAGLLYIFNLPNKMGLHVSEEPLIPSTVVFPKWLILNGEVRRQWDLLFKTDAHLERTYKD